MRAEHEAKTHVILHWANVAYAVTYRLAKCIADVVVVCNQDLVCLRHGVFHHRTQSLADGLYLGCIICKKCCNRVKHAFSFRCHSASRFLIQYLSFYCYWVERTATP